MAYAFSALTWMLREAWQRAWGYGIHTLLLICCWDRRDLTIALSRRVKTLISFLATTVLEMKLRVLEDEYEYVIADFSPSATILSEGGLRYVRELIVPVSTSYLAMIGIRQVIGTLKNVSRVPGHRVCLYLIVPTLYSPRVRQDREVLGILQRHFADRVVEPIRSNVKLTEAPSHHMTIYEYSPRSSAAADYRSLVERVLGDG